MAEALFRHETGESCEVFWRRPSPELSPGLATPPSEPPQAAKPKKRKMSAAGRAAIAAAVKKRWAARKAAWPALAKAREKAVARKPHTIHQFRAGTTLQPFGSWPN